MLVEVSELLVRVRFYFSGRSANNLLLALGGYYLYLAVS